MRAVAADYGEEAEAAVSELLARPHTLAGKPPKLPDWLAVDTLPPLRVEGGALPTDAVEAFVELLSLDPSGEGYDVELPVEPASIEAFVAHLLGQWVDHDAPGRHDWMQRAVLVFDADGPRRRVAHQPRRARLAAAGGGVPRPHQHVAGAVGAHVAAGRGAADVAAVVRAQAQPDRRHRRLAPEDVGAAGAVDQVDRVVPARAAARAHQELPRAVAVEVARAGHEHADVIRRR